MPLIRCGKPTIRLPVPGFEALTLSSVFASAPTLIGLLNNDFFQKFMRTFIKKVQALAVPAALIKARNKIDRPSKS